jgi:hypothetical protein
MHLTYREVLAEPLRLAELDAVLTHAKGVALYSV